MRLPGADAYAGATGAANGINGVGKIHRFGRLILLISLLFNEYSNKICCTWCCCFVDEIAKQCKLFCNLFVFFFKFSKILI